MTLANMRELGVHHLIGFRLNDACRHQALIGGPARLPLRELFSLLDHRATSHDEKFLATLVAGIGRTKRSTRAVDDDQLIEK